MEDNELQTSSLKTRVLFNARSVVEIKFKHSAHRKFLQVAHVSFVGVSIR
jgi:hypothetical protein